MRQLLSKLFIKSYLYIVALPFLFLFLGIASNQLVLNVNNDTFPVRLNEAKVKSFQADGAPTLADGTVMLDDTHCLMSSKTHLNWLADIIDFKTNVYSIGDFLIDLGEWLQSFCVFVWIFAVVRKIYTAA